MTCILWGQRITGASPSEGQPLEGDPEAVQLGERVCWPIRGDGFTSRGHDQTRAPRPLEPEDLKF